MAQAKDAQGVRMGHTWGTHGTHMRQACDAHGACMGHTWDSGKVDSYTNVQAKSAQDAQARSYLISHDAREFQVRVGFQCCPVEVESSIGDGAARGDLSSDSVKLPPNSKPPKPKPSKSCQPCQSSKSSKSCHSFWISMVSLVRPAQVQA